MIIVTGIASNGCLTTQVNLAVRECKRIFYSLVDTLQGVKNKAVKFSYFSKIFR